jgi:hypothetical protein
MAVHPFSLVMADGKKSFILYCDQRGIFNKLSDEQAGVLIKHIFAYVSDEDPEADFVTDLAFESIKSQLKRDLKTWEEKQEQRREAGKSSAASRQRLLAIVERNSTVVDGRSVSSTVNGNVNGNGNVTVNEKKKREGVTAPPTIDEVIAYFKENGYTEAGAKRAWDYYNASLADGKRTWTDSTGKPIKNWKMKMQSVWFKDEYKIEQPREFHRPKDPTF